MDSGVIWHSRSIAVVATLIVRVGAERYVLLNQRGPECPDHVGLWTLPCGYLDWDESAPDAARREVWEETGFDIQSITPHAGSLEHPWCVASDPAADARQNVVLHYGALFLGDAPPPVSIQHAAAGECSDVRWWPVAQALQTNLAFGHQHNLASFLAQLREP